MTRQSLTIILFYFLYFKYMYQKYYKKSDAATSQQPNLSFSPTNTFCPQLDLNHLPLGCQPCLLPLSHTLPSEKTSILQYKYQRYRESPHFVIFGTKRVSRNWGIPKFETSLSTKFQIGSQHFLKSPFIANIHKISIFKSQNITVIFINLFTRLMTACLLRIFITLYTYILFTLYVHKYGFYQYGFLIGTVF